MSNAESNTRMLVEPFLFLEEIEREEGASDYKGIIQDTGIGISKDIYPISLNRFSKQRTSN